MANIKQTVIALLFLVSCTRTTIHHCRWKECPYQLSGIYKCAEQTPGVREIDSVHFVKPELEYDEIIDAIKDGDSLTTKK